MDPPRVFLSALADLVALAGTQVPAMLPGGASDDRDVPGE